LGKALEKNEDHPAIKRYNGKSPINRLVGGIPTPLKNITVVTWGYYSQYMESHKSHVPNHQAVEVYSWEKDHSSIEKSTFSLP